MRRSGPSWDVESGASGAKPSTAPLNGADFSAPLSARPGA